MRHKIVTGLVLASLAASCSGCSSYKPMSWNPFAWSSQPRTDSVSPDINQQKYDTYTRDLSKPPGQQQQSWLASSWKSTTDTLSAPFKSKTTEEDPVSLGTKATPSPQFYVTTGQMYEAKGDAPGAIAQYEKALQLSSNDLNARISLARLYDRQGDLPKAIGQYQQAAVAHPSSGLVHNDMGLCLARHQQIPQAIGELEQAVRIEPGNQMYRNNLATVLIESGRDQDAFGHLAAVNPPAVARYNFGYLLHQRGHNEAAVRELQMALSMDPSLVNASNLLTQLQPAGNLAGGYGGVPVAPVGYPAGNPAEFRR